MTVKMKQDTVTYSFIDYANKTALDKYTQFLPSCNKTMLEKSRSFQQHNLTF